MHMSRCPVGSSNPVRKGSSRTFRNRTLAQFGARVDSFDRHNLDARHGTQGINVHLTHLESWPLRAEPLFVFSRSQALLSGPAVPDIHLLPSSEIVLQPSSTRRSISFKLVWN